jgi:hypothetical protein
MATANYIWEFGIDWNASERSLYTCYMPGGFTTTDDPSGAKRPVVVPGGQITFNIFNLVEDKLQEISIQSFTINPQPGAFNALNSFNICPFDMLQPVLTPFQSPTASIFFGGTHPGWQGKVNVTSPPNQRFLLSFWVQATNTQPPSDQPSLLTFIQDPEMVVGPNT